MCGFVYFLAPLQPFLINGREQRNRMLSNGPIVHHQSSSILPPAASLQSLSSAINTTGNVTFANPIEQSVEIDENEKLKMIYNN